MEGKKWNKECSNNHIIHLNAEANYRDKCDFLFSGGSLWWNQRSASERAGVTEETLNTEIWSLRVWETTGEATWRSRDKQREEKRRGKMKKANKIIKTPLTLKLFLTHSSNLEQKRILRGFWFLLFNYAEKMYLKRANSWLLNFVTGNPPRDLFLY